MELVEALRRLKPVVTKDTPYVRGTTTGRVLATDYKHWVTASCGIRFEFTVDHHLLLTALELRPKATVESDGDRGVIVREGRTKVVVRGVDDTFVPPPPAVDDGEIIRRTSLPPALMPVLKTLLRWVDPETTVWMQGVHISPAMVWVANRSEAVASRLGVEGAVTVTLPTWLVRTMIAGGQPTRLLEFPRGLLVRFLDEMQVYSLKLSDAVPEAAEAAVRDMLAIPTDPVPEGLADAVAMFAKYGLTTMLTAEGVAYSDANASEGRLALTTALAVGGKERRWKVKNFADILPLAETMELLDDRCKWAGGGWKGVFMGMTR